MGVTLLPEMERKVGVQRLVWLVGSWGSNGAVCGISVHCAGMLGASLFGFWGIGVLGVSSWRWVNKCLHREG